MKKSLFTTALLFFSLLSFSQQLTFCESVDNKGNPDNPSKHFAISFTGGSLEALVTLPRPVKSTFATFDIFLIQDKTEIFESTIRQNLKPDFSWFSKEITFHKTGDYNVYVYDDKDKLLCVGRVTIKIQ